MGRASRKDKKKAPAGGKAKKQPASAASAGGTIEGLIEQAEACVGNYDYDQALQFFQQALQMEPNRTELLDQVGELLLEIGEHEKAKAVLVQSVQLAPDGSFATYMYLGQLLTGADAVACFDRGQTLLLQEIAKEQDAIVTQGLRRKLSSAMCSRGEVYMTDLCDLPQAEEECGKSLASAVQYDESNPDAWVAKANFHICQQDAPSALECLNKACALVEAIEDDAQLPPFEVRLSIGKMLVELAEHAKVTEVLEDLLAEDDEHVEVLFMLATAYKELGEADSAREVTQRCAELYAKLPHKERNPMVQSKIQELVTSLQT